MAQDGPRPRTLRGDEAELFRAHEVALHAAVRHHVRTTDAIVEDACAFAWLQLMRRQPNRDTVFPWIRTVAIREALRLHRLATRHTSTDLVPDDQLPSRGDLSTELHVHEILDAIRTLSPHQRTLLTLFVSGHSYDEISHLQNVSHTSVSKALVRARRHLRLVRDAD